MSEQRWYFNRGLKPQGPFTFQEMKKAIYKGEVGPMDLVMEESQGKWMIAMSFSGFEAKLFPAMQLLNGQGEGAGDWVLLIQQEGRLQVAPSGPFSLEGVKELVNKGIYSPTTSYIWKPGLSGWCRLSDRLECESQVRHSL